VSTRASSRRVAITLDPEMWAAVTQYRDSLGGEGSGGMIDAARELIRVGLSMAPTDAAFLAARAHITNEMRSYAAQRLIGMLGELQREIAERYGVEVMEERSHGG
jgi:hypothetical protein